MAKAGARTTPTRTYYGHCYHHHQRPLLLFRWLHSRHNTGQPNHQQPIAATTTTKAPYAAKWQKFFGTTSPSSNGGGSNGDDPSFSPDMLSVTSAGGSSELEDDPPKTAAANRNNRDPSSLFTVPIVIEMPKIDDDDESSSSAVPFFVETWHKRPGDRLDRDDVLCDISTPDFVFGMQIDDEQAGIMGEIHVQQGVGVPCHTPICTIYHQEEVEE